MALLPLSKTLILEGGDTAAEASRPRASDSPSSQARDAAPTHAPARITPPPTAAPSACSSRIGSLVYALPAAHLLPSDFAGAGAGELQAEQVLGGGVGAGDVEQRVAGDAAGTAQPS